MIMFNCNLLRSVTIAVLGVALAPPVEAEAVDSQGLAQLLQKLENRIEELDQEIETIKRTAIIVQSGTFAMVARNTRGLRDASACPAAETGDAYRGTLNGRINFSQEFSENPEVVLALREASISPVTRLNLAVTTVDEKGFNYSFTTHCTTIIYDADAVWVAHGRTSQ